MRRPRERERKGNKEREEVSWMRRKKEVVKRRKSFLPDKTKGAYLHRGGGPAREQFPGESHPGSFGGGIHGGLSSDRAKEPIAASPTPRITIRYRSRPRKSQCRRARTSQLESMIASLTKEVRSLKASSTPPPTKTKKPSTATQHSTPKQTPSQVQKSPEKTQPSQPKTATGKHKSNPVLSSPAATSTPKRQIHANSAPPESLKVFKAPSPQHNPKQMTTGDFPPEFNSTKVNSLPSFPVLKSADSFIFLECTVCSHQDFVGPSNTRCIKQATQQTQSPLLINTNEVQLFKQAQAGSIKFGRQLIHLGSNNICHAQVLMVCTWSPPMLMIT
ncbi:hypothetical protein VP01_324g1 [Puccinia sorghi]|uniref:Uncharacterized protein n=1 Tax=Puccinia sorghi TaxID=27349 RepID=A0A0L6UXZ6_9BASI|nr:hypothetical protein VP01_324g1 [Puccinia sorghi]